MIARLRKFLAQRRASRDAEAREREAVAHAIRSFEQTNKGQQALREMCIVIYSDADKCIVRVCYGATRPPRRAFFEVRTGGGIGEVTLRDAKDHYGETRWR